jgi:CRP-like cAMP-binding protein
MPHVDLLELPYFDGLTINDMVSLVDRMTPARWSAGDEIVREGDPPPPLYIATAGSVSISKRGPGGGSRNLAELESPTLFGEIELFCQIPAIATARALDRVSTFALTRAEFDRLLAEHHPAAMLFTANVARVACHRLAIADEMMTRLLGDEDLVKLRRIAFASLADENGWSQTTGVFKKPIL